MTVDLTRAAELQSILDARSAVTPAGCREWTSTRGHDGYGVINIDGIQYRAHRLAWAVTHGEQVPEGWVVLHTCDNPPCILAAHLRAGTQGDNVRDCSVKGRISHGEAHRSAKLTAVQARALRDRAHAGEPIGSLAREFGIRLWAAQKIRDGKTWRSA